MTTPRRTGARPPRPSEPRTPAPAEDDPQPERFPLLETLSDVAAQFRRRILPWVVAPASMLLVFLFGLAIVWVPSLPRLVVSPVGPTVGSVGEPVQLKVPSIDIDAPVVPIEMDRTRILSPPADVKKVGWWKRSAEPGAKEGQTLITGHSVRLGDGVMDRLGDVKRGATVQVVGTKKGTKSSHQVASYLVQSVFVYSRKEVAAHSADLFGQNHHPRRLVLVTCTDWDGQEYRSNIIVYALPA